MNSNFNSNEFPDFFSLTIFVIGCEDLCVKMQILSELTQDCNRQNDRKPATTYFHLRFTNKEIQQRLNKAIKCN